MPTTETQPEKQRTLKILFATSEVVPFAKTGGLADVCGTLPSEIARLGPETCVVMPAFRSALNCGQPVRETGVQLEIPVGTKTVSGSVLESRLPDSDIPVYLIDQPRYYDRDGLYGDATGDFEDNCERFVFFGRSVLEVIRALDLKIDLIHVNDWPTGLIPAYLRTEYAGLPGYERIATLFTIHNLAYQGTFWHWDMLLTGLDWKYFNWRQMEFHGNLNFMKTGIAFADALNTVSPTYAEEIQLPELGCHLDGLLSHRTDVLTGITNGVDYRVWDPAIDLSIPAQYDVESYADGKSTCKAALQEELGLVVDAETPLIGLVGRLADQKGFDLITPLIQKRAPAGTYQWAILGSGSPEIETRLRQLAAEFPNQIALHLGFSEPLAHRIEAGADMFLMPSRYE
ncbi:MAG: glycogen/starch synthase, partial [Pirellulales bacterium]